jgi:hypothetical protein
VSYSAPVNIPAQLKNRQDKYRVHLETIDLRLPFFALLPHFSRSLSYYSFSVDNNQLQAYILFERFDMDSKVRLLVLAVFIAVVLWLLGGFVFGHALGIVCVFTSIVVVGWAAGNLMNTPEPSQENK